MADAVFFGDVITMAGNGKLQKAEAVAVLGGKIMAVGCEEEVMTFVRPKTKLVEIRDKVILPGLIEPHSHPDTASRVSGRVDVSGFNPTTAEGIWQILRNAVAATEPGEWVVATGFNPVLVAGLKSPSRDDLDEIAPDNPVAIFTSSMHTCFVNSLAFACAGITDSTLDPPGGRFVRDEQGRLTGKCDEVPAMVAVSIHIPAFTEHEHRYLLTRQLEAYATNGFTTVAALALLLDTAGILEELVSSPESPIRLVVYQDNEKFDFRKGIPGRDGFCQMGIKRWADGSPYSGTMATAEPYLDTPLTRALHFDEYPSCGRLNHTREKLFQDFLPFHREAWQLAVHAHGERAIDTTLDVYESLLQEHPRQDHRHRIEHCGLITKTQMQRARELRVTLSFFIDHIYYFGRALRDSIIGEERAERFMPLYSANKAGHKWTLHSDSPCCPLGPFRVLKAAVTRQVRREITEDLSSEPEIIGQEERVGIDEALRAMTSHAAWQLFHDEVIGSIEVGKIADFTMVSENPYNIDPYELDTIEIISTYRDGRKVVPFVNKH